MGTRAHRKLHVALPATLHERERQAIHKAIETYATEMAGSAADLDQGLEATGIEHLRNRRHRRCS